MISHSKRAFAALLGVLAFHCAQAQPTTRFVTGSTPGGSVDTVARLLAESMGPVLGRTIVVDSRPGASYTIAADLVAKAPPDGTTALVTFNVHPISGALFRSLPFDPVKDFRAVGMIATTPYAIVANPKVPGANLKEMIALAKSQGRSLSFASIGLGTPQHLMMERLKQQTGVDIQMVHYKSSNATLTDVVAGHLDFTIPTIAFVEPQVKAGRVKVLAVTSKDRLPQFPDAPTVVESGYQGFVTDGWYAILLPARTPAAVVSAYSDALRQVLALPAINEKFKALGLTPTAGSPEAVDRQISEDAAMWKKIIVERDIKPE